MMPLPNVYNTFYWVTGEELSDLRLFQLTELVQNKDERAKLVNEEHGIEYYAIEVWKDLTILAIYVPKNNEIMLFEDIEGMYGY